MLELVFPLGGEAVPVHVPENDDDLREFRRWFMEASARGPIALDTETTGLDIFSPGYRLRTVQFGDETQAWVILWELGGHFVNAVLWALRMGSAFTIHNAPFDWLVLDTHAGITVEELARKTVDSRILAILVDPRQPMEGGVGTALKPLAAHYIDPNAPDTQAGLQAEFRAIGATKETGWARIDLWNRLYLAYAGGDVILTARVRRILEAIHAQRRIRPALTAYEHEIARICTIMQRTGLVLDQAYVAELDERLSAEEAKYSAVARQFGVTSVNSSDQVAEALQGMGVHLTEKTDGGAWKVDKAILTYLAGLTLKGEPIEGAERNPLAYAVYRAKRAGKWRTTYVQTFLDTVDSAGRIHPFINTLQARTGRMSITRPALQTLPSGDWMIRRAMLADPGHVMISVDFTAVELRVLAALADVRAMKEAINAGRDLHDFTAELVYGAGFTTGHRKICKGVGFGKVYGGGAFTIARQTGADQRDVEHALKVYDRVYPEIKRAARRWEREARALGMVTVTPTGRYLPLDPKRAYAVVNYQCQSTARDCLGQALIEMDEAGLLPYLRLPIHDEVLASAPKAEAADIAREIARCMTMNLSGVPIDADPEVGGLSWGSLYGAAL
jgi:DNA polymerase-1